jgi:carbonic anhydrase/acetyltransferase-like protein (isoleucine patch superfamily)
MEEQQNGAAGVLDAPAAVEPVKKIRKKRASKHDFKDGRGRVFAHRHINGGGWVADTAKVADSVLVAKGAQVYHNAVITNRVEIKNRAHVCGNAQLSGAVKVLNYSLVSGTAILTDDCQVRDTARVHGGHLSGSTMLRQDTFVRGGPRLHSCSLRDFAGVSGRATAMQTSLEGWAYIGGEAQVSGSVLRGYVTVSGRAQVIGSKLVQLSIYTNEPNDPTCEMSRLKVLDYTIVANVEALTALLCLRGHTVVAGGRIVFRPEYDSARGAYIRLDSHDDALFAGTIVDSLQRFNLYNVSRSEQRSQNLYTPAAVANLPRPINMNELVPSRRLMSM